MQVIWFMAKDVIKRDFTPFKERLESSKEIPTQWDPFTIADSIRIEKCYLKHKKGKSYTLPMIMDGLFEVDIEKLELSPIYWKGPIREVRRGLWFEPKGPGGSYTPCDESFTNQVEEGYQKLWVARNVEEYSTKPIPRWNLFANHIGEFATYHEECVAYIQTDALTSKLSRALFTTSGTKVLRTWNEAENYLKKRPNPPRPVSPALEVPKPEKQGSAESLYSESGELVEPSKRKVDHLLFVVHGVGQKLSQSTDSISFTYDCDVLRDGLRVQAENLRKELKSKNHPQADTIPENGGIQVLPVMWRHHLELEVAVETEFSDTEDDERVLSVADILPEGIPGIRMLVSDVVVDVLLYMTPKYRQRMITHVSKELNRLFNLYKEKNPDFVGTGSIYGHSLGSIISFDIACCQGRAPEEMFTAISSPIPGIDISDVLGHAETPASISWNAVSGIECEDLDFDINHLFVVGSPIGLFLLLGGYCLRPTLELDLDVKKERNAVRPRIKALYNIFHPYDPVAHRLEPLFSYKLTSLKPVPVHYTKGGLTHTVMSIEQTGNEIVQKGKTYVLDLAKSANYFLGNLPLVGSGNIPPLITAENANQLDDTNTPLSEGQGLRTSPPTVIVESKPSNTNIGASTDVKGASAPVDTKQQPKAKARSEYRKPNENQEKVIERLKSLNPHGRLDYHIQSWIMENPYISSLAVHMNYWSDMDANALLLRSLYSIDMNIGKKP